MTGENEQEGFDPAAEADAEGVMIDDSDEDAQEAEVAAQLNTAAAQVTCVVLPMACINEGKGAPIGMGLQRWFAQHLSRSESRAAAPVFTALADRNGRQVPALMVYSEPWTPERAWEGVEKFPNATTALLGNLHVDDEVVKLDIDLCDSANGSLTSRKRFGFEAPIGDVPERLFDTIKGVAGELGLDLDADGWVELFGCEDRQGVLNFLVGLGNLSALQGRVVPSTSDQLLSPLVDAINRDPAFDAPVAALHAMVEILMANQPDRAAIPLSLQALQIAAQRRPNDKEVQFHLALVVRRLGDLPASVSFFNQAFNLDPSDVRITATFIETLRRLSDAENAIKVAEFALERGCDGPVVLAQLGSLLIEADRFDEAEPFLRRAVDEGKVPSAYGDLANVLWDRSNAETAQGAEDRADALSLLEKALELPRVAKSTLDMLLDLHEDEGQERALELLLIAAERHPQDPAVQIAVANAYLDGDDPERARPFLERVLVAPRRSLDDDAFARRQLLALGQDDFDDAYDAASKGAQSPDPARRASAAVFFRGLIARDANYWQPHMFLALSVRATEGDAAALAHLNNAVRLRPNDPGLRALAGALLKQMGRPREAVEHLGAQVSLQPREIAPVIQLAETMRDANMFAEARQVCEQALQRIPNHPDFSRILASLPQPAKA